MTGREAAFLEYVQQGGQIETTDWMPDDYRAKLIKFIEMHGNSELMGVLPEREWILRAPTLQRKLALTAKVQDEVGHAQLIYRVVEDLGKPREQCLADLVSGKAKFHNVFHYPTRTWGDVGVIAWLVDAAAIISQKALLKCSYAPYARIMKKICWEESFHILHGRDVILALVTGTPEQFELVQEALIRWWPPLMQFHGNPLPRDEDPMFQCRIKSQGNEEARQQLHAGSLVAPDATFAEAWAREQYGRRGESVALWLVPREAVHAVEDWADEFDLKYRRVDGYSIKARLKEARERAAARAG